MYSSAYVWAKVLSNMEERLGAVTVSAWFDDAEVVELTDDQLVAFAEGITVTDQAQEIGG